MRALAGPIALGIMYSQPPQPDPSSLAHFELRYDDLTQHGHIKLTTLQLALGRVGFEKLWVKHPLFETRRQGIAPILSRMVLEAEPVPVSLTSRAQARGHLVLAHERSADGNVSALFMNSHGAVWATLSRRSGSSQRQLVRVGRAFGEHVFTKPFGDPADRKVLAFDVPGQPPVPAARHMRVRHLDTLRLPEAAEPLDADFEPDDSPWVFGLAHTDENQHVNSLVYARMFEEAALRRLHRYTGTSDLLGLRIELNYRKPCFAGDRTLCLLRAFRSGQSFGAVGYLTSRDLPKERAHCSFQLRIGRIAGARPGHAHA